MLRSSKIGKGSMYQKFKQSPLIAEKMWRYIFYYCAFVWSEANHPSNIITLPRALTWRAVSMSPRDNSWRGCTVKFIKTIHPWKFKPLPEAAVVKVLGCPVAVWNGTGFVSSSVTGNSELQSALAVEESTVVAAFCCSSEIHSYSHKASVDRSPDLFWISFSRTPAWDISVADSALKEWIVLGGHQQPHTFSSPLC